MKLFWQEFGWITDGVHPIIIQKNAKNRIYQG